MPTKTAKKPAKRKATTAKKRQPASEERELFVTNKMRRDAEQAAKDEADRLRRAEEDAEDERLAAGFASSHPEWSDAERAFRMEQAQNKVVAAARRKYGLTVDGEESGGKIQTLDNT